eukprot:scaffold8227_cov172-Ochromonas_danica.AAC.3
MLKSKPSERGKKGRSQHSAAQQRQTNSPRQPDCQMTRKRVSRLPFVSNTGTGPVWSGCCQTIGGNLTPN